jgi:hypothetical protein
MSYRQCRAANEGNFGIWNDKTDAKSERDGRSRESQSEKSS